MHEISKQRRLWPVLWRYQLRRLVLYTLILTLLLTLALSLDRLLRMLEEATQAKIPAADMLPLLVYLLPHYSSLGLPAALFLAALLHWRGWHERSELVIWQHSGIGWGRMLLPSLALACVCSLLMLGLTGYLQPHARYAFRAAYSELRQSHAIAAIRPGVFNHLPGGLLLRAERLSDNGRMLHDVFLTEQTGKQGDTLLTDQAQERRIILAKTASLALNERQSDLIFRLHAGVMLVEQKDGAVYQTRFSRYTRNVPYRKVGAEAYGPRGQDERELTLGELLRGGMPGIALASDVTRSMRQAEWHARLVHSLSLPFLVWLALPLALLGRGRGGRAYGLTLGVALLVLYKKMLGAAEA